MSEIALELPVEFLAITACPTCRAKLAVDYGRSELVYTSTACGLAYPVENRIPVLLIDQARDTQ